MNLRVVARVREIDRRLFTIRIFRRGIRWVLLPGVAIVALLILARVPWLAAGAALTDSEGLLDVLFGAPALLGSLAAVIGSLLAASRATRDLRENVAELVEERRGLLAGTEAVGARARTTHRKRHRIC